jgi:hypothetical protein
MTQNKSHAVMAQRSEPHDSLDFFPTPPWATRAFCYYLSKQVPEIGSHTVWEPACGEGHMARPLAEYFGNVIASDVHPYGHGTVLDFLFPSAVEEADWIITNPPFRLGKEFALTALDRARVGVALLVRTAFLEGGDRFATLFAVHRPVAILQYCERVPMVKGRYDPNASTATSYCWVMWRRPTPTPNDRTLFFWIPPCKAKFERPGD